LRPAKGVGHTHLLAQLARENNGVVICRDAHEAERIKKTYNAEAIAYQQAYRIRGLKSPIFVDVDAFICAAEDIEKQTTDLHRVLQAIEPALRAYLQSTPPGLDKSGMYLWCEDGGRKRKITALDVERLLQALY